LQASSPKNAGVFEGVTAYHRLVSFIAAAVLLFDCTGQRLSMKNYLPERIRSNGVRGTWQEVYIFIAYREEHMARRRNFAAEITISGSISSFKILPLAS
jgi:hypothetical protein